MANNTIDKAKKKKITAPSIKPLQNTSLREKMKDDYFLVKQTGEYFISRSRFGNSESNQDIKNLYDIYNGSMPQELFRHITNPLNDSKNRSFPAQIRPYMLLRENLDLLKGEFPRRPFKYLINVPGEESYNDYQKGLSEHLNQTLQNLFVNSVGNLENGQEPEPIDLNTVIENYRSNYNDIRIKTATDALQIIKQEEKLQEKWNEMFEDYLIAGSPYSLKNVVRGDVVYERINPLNIDYDNSLRNKYKEDAEWACILDYLTLSDVVDEYYDKISEEEFKNIQETPGVSTYSPHGLYSTINTSLKDQNGDRIEVIRYYYKAKKKIGYLTYPDPDTGEILEDIVSEDYKPNKELGEKVKWEWVNEVWQGARIHGDIYTTPEPVPMQRNKMNNFSYCKLPINGINFSDNNSENISFMRMGLPYQIMYVIINYKIELLISKSKGKMIMLDGAVIPSDEDNTEEDFFYNGEAKGWLRLDLSNPRRDKHFNQYQTLDLSMFDEIGKLVEYAEYIRSSWDTLVGVNRQRKGQNNASDGKGVNDEAIFRGSIMSDYIFRQFDEFRVSELQGLVDHAQVAWKEGKKGLYRSDMLRNELVNVDPEIFASSEYKLFVTDSSEENENLQAVKANLQGMIQNGLAQASIVDVVMAKNMSDMKHILQESQKMSQESLLREAKSEQEKEQIKEQVKQETAKLESLLDTAKMHEEYDRKKELELIKAQANIFSFQGTGDTDGDGVLDAAQIADMNLQQVQHNDKMTLEKDKLKLQEKISKAQEETKRKVAENQLKIAKENKNKHDKK